LWRRQADTAASSCWRLASFVGSLVLLGGCQAESPEARFHNYLDRLATALSVGATTPEFIPTPRPPRSGKLRLEIPSDSLDTLDFLALSGCAVQVTIGKRNSSLGRMAKSSQRLLLELEYLRLAPDCISHLRDSGKDTLADLLEQSWRHKQEQLPALIFNATLGADEYRALWLASPTVADYPRVSSSVTIPALLAINQLVRRWLAGDYEADNRSFELLLGEVAGGGGGTLLKALSRQHDWLATADLLLQQRMIRGPLCAPGIRFAAADILPLVIRKHFIGEIQPQAARMSRRFYDLLPPVTELEEDLAGIMPYNYRGWMAARNTYLDEVTGAPRRHVEQLKAIQEPCMVRSQ
jgi:hypothetical protein